MGASSTGLRSTQGDTDIAQRNQRSMIVPRLSNVENNNNHIFENPHNFLPIHTMMDECDLLNNNTTLINNNYLTVTSLTSPSSNTTLTTTYNKLNKKQTLYRLSEEHAAKKDEKPKQSPKKSPKKEKEKKKKEKPKPPRAPAGVGKGRGMAEQDQMMKRPRKIKNDKELEK